MSDLAVAGSIYPGTLTAKDVGAVLEGSHDSKALPANGFDNRFRSCHAHVASAQALAHRSNLVFGRRARLFQFGIVQDGVPDPLLGEIQKRGEHDQEHRDLEA
jgi:hypothetical protein